MATRLSVSATGAVILVWVSVCMCISGSVSVCIFKFKRVIMYKI